MTTERANERRLAWLFNKSGGLSVGWSTAKKWILEAIRYGEAYGLQVARDAMCPYCRGGVPLTGNCHPAKQYCAATPIREELAQLGIDLTPELTDRQLSLLRLAALTTIAFGNRPEERGDRNVLVAAALIFRDSTVTYPDTYRATKGGKRFVAQLQPDHDPQASLEDGDLTARNPGRCE